MEKKKKIIIASIIAVAAIIGIILFTQSNSKPNTEGSSDFKPLTVGDKPNNYSEEKTDESNDSSSDTGKEESTQSDNSGSSSDDGEQLEPGIYSDGSDLVIVIGEDEEIAGG